MYDGFDDISKAWANGLKPDPLLTISEWADKYRFLSSKSSSEPGRWRTSRTPYLKEIMDCLSPSSDVQRIVFMKGTQVGGTECGNNWIGYVIHQAPAPMMSVSPTVELAKRTSKQRLDPLIEESKELRALIQPKRSRDSGNTILSKEFPGGVLIMTGANSAVGLRSMPACYLFLDEVDGYPPDVEGEGSPVLLAEKRADTFARRKIMLVSTPKIKGISCIEREFNESDMRYYFVPCPECGGMQRLVFENLTWTDTNEVSYVCEHCGCLIEEHHKTKMFADGEWRSTSESSKKTAGFHLSALYSPVGWKSWSKIAEEYEEAKKYPDLMKGFVNTVLGEAYEEEAESPDWNRLYERRESYRIGEVPDGVMFLTSGVDIQKDRIELEVVGWGRNKESWSIDYRVLDGDTARKEVWEDLAEIVEKDFRCANGDTMPLRVMCVDSGYATQDVYSWVRKYKQALWSPAGASARYPRTVVAIKGQDKNTALLLGVSKVDTVNKKRGLKVWGIGTHLAKGELYRWLKLDSPVDDEEYPYGFCHFPEYKDEFFKQLTAEKLVTKIVKGYPKQIWIKDGQQRNEALDCRVYARAAASIYGIDRFTDRQWKKIENARIFEPVKKDLQSKDDSDTRKASSELAALKKAYAAGVLSVKYDDKTVEYGSESDLKKRIATVEKSIAADAGTSSPTTSYASFSRG